MSTHNIQFHDKNKKKKSLNICFLSYWKNFVGTEKRVRIIHGKRAIRVRAIEVILYVRNMRTIDNIIYNKETPTKLKYFASLPYGLLLKNKIYRFQTLKVKTLLHQGYTTVCGSLFGWKCQVEEMEKKW